MSYVCVDRGTEHCPCVLMAAGQCYTCSMMDTGVCDCGSRSGWQGVCPYTEFLQNGQLPGPAAPALRAGVVSRKTYADDLTVVSLRVPRGFARRCRRLGSFVMVRPAGYPEAGWQTPLSVLRAEDTDGLLSFAVKPAGPKTQALLAAACREWEIAGPYFNGLLNSEAFVSGQQSFVVAKGTAVAPLICMREELVAGGVRLYLDMDKLTEDFVADYLGDVFWARAGEGDQDAAGDEGEGAQGAAGDEGDDVAGESVQGAAAGAAVWQTVQLSDSTALQRVSRALQAAATAEPPQNLLTLVSPYYAEKLQAAVSAEGRKRLIWPNPANLCCACGLCGACAYTDENGVTVRRCKCNHSA